MMKKIFFIAFALFFSMMAMAQQVVKHTVVAGETITSVAAKYGVSEADIKDANPETKQYFYTGMELVIPNKGKAVTETTTHVAAPASNYKETNYSYGQNNVSGSHEKEGNAGKVGATSEALFGYLIPSLGEGVESKFCAGLSVALGAKYYATDNVYIEGMAGYKCLFQSSKVKGDTQSITSQIHNITIPLHLGVSIPSSSRVALGLFAGTRVDIPVSSKSEYGREKIKLDVPVHAVIEAGLNIKVSDDIAIRLQYDYSPAKSVKYSLISIGVASAF